MRLKNKTAIVTGGAMGIGLETSKILVAEGAVVTIWDINENELVNAKKNLEAMGGKIFTHVCDVTKIERVNELTKVALEEMGSVNILVNNAGYVKGGEFIAQPLDAWEKTVDVNLTAILNTTYAVLPHMYENNFGHIVNISSAAGLLGVPDLSVYAATKWAVWGFTESMRYESWNQNKHGIKWSSIHPMYIATGMFEGAKLGFLGNLITPNVKSHDVIAKAIVYDAIIKGKYVVRRPKTLRLAIILRGILPDFIFQKIMLMMGVNKSMKTWKGRN
jgi:all-trans-retinol dehydrogenase (NAD+)